MSEWISVSDKRKPPLEHDEDTLSVSILVYAPELARSGAIASHAIRLGRYSHYFKEFRPDGTNGCEKYVTHWMPLPAPPEDADKAAGEVLRDSRSSEK